MISSEVEAQVSRLFHVEKWPVGTIARELALHHTTVQRILRQQGNELKVVAPRPSVVDPFIPFILEQLEKHPRLCASRLFAMVKERGYPGAPDHFRRLIGRIRPRRAAEAFQRLRTLPGEQAQVDWAHFGKLQCGRATRTLWAFVMVLSFSRRLVVRFYLGSSMPFFLQGHVEAFARFGGVPRVLLYDNLKSAVLERVGDAIRFNPKLLELAAYHRFEPRPVAVARGNEKGRVERAIRYVRDAFFEARMFNDVADLNRQVDAWTEGDALARPWVEDRRRTVRDAFQDESSLLLPLPADPFNCEERLPVEIGKTPYARFDLNDYSVPHDRVQRTLVVHARVDVVRFVDGNTLVAEHPRSWDRDQQIECAEHLDRLVAEKRRARGHRGLDRLSASSPSVTAFLTALAARAGNIGSTTARLLRLLNEIGASELEAAIAEALAQDTIHVGAVRQIVDQRRAARGLAPQSPVTVSQGRHSELVVRPHQLSTYDGLKTETPE